MIEYKSNTILSTIKNNNQKVVLFGAGQIGEICLFAINQKHLWKGFSICAIRAILVNAGIFYTYDTILNWLN